MREQHDDGDPARKTDRAELQTDASTTGTKALAYNGDLTGASFGINKHSGLHADAGFVVEPIRERLRRRPLAIKMGTTTRIRQSLIMATNVAEVIYNPSPRSRTARANAAWEDSARQRSDVRLRHERL